MTFPYSHCDSRVLSPYMGCAVHNAQMYVFWYPGDVKLARKSKVFSHTCSHSLCSRSFCREGAQCDIVAAHAAETTSIQSKLSKALQCLEQRDACGRQLCFTGQGGAIMKMQGKQSSCAATTFSCHALIS